jgi:hypothetical protein
MTIPDLFILGANLNETFPGSWILTHVVFCFKKFHSVTVAYPVEYSLLVTEIKLAWKYLLLIQVLIADFIPDPSRILIIIRILYICHNSDAFMYLLLCVAYTQSVPEVLRTAVDGLDYSL